MQNVRKLGREPPAWIRQYVGIEFRERGRTRAGCDCGGLAVIFYRERFGIEIEADETDYSVAGPLKAFAKHKALEQTTRGWLQVDPGGEQFADIMVTRTGRALHHVGIIVARGWWLHTEEGFNSGVERYSALKLRNYAVFRHPNLVTAS